MNEYHTILMEAFIQLQTENQDKVPEMYRTEGAWYDSHPMTVGMFYQVIERAGLIFEQRKIR